MAIFSPYMNVPVEEIKKNENDRTSNGSVEIKGVDKRQRDLLTAYYRLLNKGKHVEALALINDSPIIIGLYRLLFKIYRWLFKSTGKPVDSKMHIQNSLRARL